MSESDQTPLAPPPGSMPPGSTPPAPTPLASMPPAPTPSASMPPGMGTPPASGNKNGLGVAALVLGLVGLLGGFIIPFSGLGSILAIIFGAIGLKRVKRGEANNRGMALAGLWLGIAGVALSFIVVVVIGILMAASN